MASPITWRNVGNTVSGSGAPGLIAQAQQQTQQGMNALQDLVRANVKQNQQNQLATAANNTNDYLDRVAAADLATLATPEGQQALEAIRTGFGTAIDRNATRNAIQDRLAAGQKAAVQQGQYDDFVQGRNERSAVDSLYGLAAANDRAGVERALAENQFLDEGALRKELYGTLDQNQQRQYRANAEGRANRAEARSAASHALSMETGRENLAYAKTMHGEAVRKVNEARIGDDLANQIFGEQRNNAQAQQSVLAQIAEDNGVGLQADGTLNLEVMSPELRSKVTKEMSDAGLGGQTATKARQRLLSQLDEAGVSGEGKKNALLQYDNLQSLSGLAPEDQARAQNAAANATREITDTQTRLTEEYNRKAQNNPFMAPSNDAIAEVNKLGAQFQKENNDQWLSTDVNLQSFNRAATKLATEGITVKLDGKETNIVVPPSVIEMAARDVGANKIAAEGPDVRKAVERIFKENPGLQRQAVEAQTGRATYQNDMAKLGVEKIKREKSVLDAYKKESGVVVSPNDWIDAALRRNK